jgi:hypothetical protein
VWRHRVWIIEGERLVPGVVGDQELIWVCCASYVKTEYPYTPVTPTPSPAVGHSPGFSMNQFRSGLAAFSSQNVGCYSSSSVPMYGQDPRDMVVMAQDTTGLAHNALAMSGLPTGYRYSLGLPTGHE